MAAAACRKLPVSAPDVANTVSGATGRGGDAVQGATGAAGQAVGGVSPGAERQSPVPATPSAVSWTAPGSRRAGWSAPPARPSTAFCPKGTPPT